MPSATDPSIAAPNLSGGLCRSVMVVAIVVMMIGTLAASHGVSWAGPAALENGATPLDLSGRWSGTRYGYGVAAQPAGDCAGKPCRMTFDIVACGSGWCGIAVADETKCGAIGLRLTASPDKARKGNFDGSLELAEGSAPFVLKAWYHPGRSSEAAPGTDTPAHLGMVGDTGTELLMMRRSFPLQADLARTGEALCTLPKATS